MSIRVLLLLLLLLCWKFNLFAQEELQVKENIDSINYEVVGNIIFIKYNLIEPRGNYYNIYVKAFDSKGNEVMVSPVSGDYENVLSGYNKYMIWKLENEGLDPDSENNQIELFVISELIEEKKKDLKPINKQKAFLLSTVYPGNGTYRLTGKQVHKIKGAVGYGFLVTSILFYQTALSTYADYEDESSIKYRNPLYDKALKQKTISEIFMYSAISIWFLEYVNIYFAKNDILNNKISLGYKIDDFSRSSMISFYIDF